jgi:hypothetical protein
LPQCVVQSIRQGSTIACVQPQQHEQHLVPDVEQQECASTAAPLDSNSAVRFSKAAAAALVLSKLQSKWRQLAVWCRQHRVQQLLWG